MLLLSMIVCYSAGVWYGLGLQKALSLRWQVGAGYVFADWGESNFGRSAEQTLNQGLTINRLYINHVLFNITYLA